MYKLTFKLVNAYKKLLQDNFGSISLYYYIDKITENRLSLFDHILSKQKKWPKNPPPLPPPLLVTQFENIIDEDEEESYGDMSVMEGVEGVEGVEGEHTNISISDNDSTDSTSSDTI